MSWDAADGSFKPVQPVEPVLPVQKGTPLEPARAWFERYITTVNDHDLDLLTLWTAHTHLAFETYTTPRLLTKVKLN